jgi:hypothetical protein
VFETCRHTSDCSARVMPGTIEVVGSRGLGVAFARNVSQPMCDSAVPAAHGGPVYYWC